MANPHGMPIWYELLTRDPDAAQDFYCRVVGWTVSRPPMGPPDVDYRLFSAGETMVGGVMKMPDDAPMPPLWAIYFGVDDVDSASAKAAALGASVHLPPTDIPGVGRFSFLADPQGCVFYVMRGLSPEQSRAFVDGSAGAPPQGHAVWNELATPDPDAAVTLYADLLHFCQDGAMPMGEHGAYRFWHVGDTRIGAVMKTMPGGENGWLIYFSVDDIDAANDRLVAAGGTSLHEPSEIPGGTFMLTGRDPQGARFGLVGPRLR